MTQFRGPRIVRVFVGSAAFFALADQDDNRYNDAQALQQRLIADRSAWFTSNFIVAETHALFLTRLGIRLARQFLDRLELSSVTVIRVSPGDEVRAKAIIRQYDDKDFCRGPIHRAPGWGGGAAPALPAGGRHRRWA